MASKSGTKTPRTRVKTRTQTHKVWPPVKKNDPRVLGEGYYKFAWKMYPTNQVAVINSFDEQILRQKPKGWKFRDWLASYTEKMILEYQFTEYVHRIFGRLIPRVFLFKKEEYFFYDRKFRYQKEICLPVEKNETIFHAMFKIEDYLLDQGWAYIDMKDLNLGILNGKYCLVDTDPFQFYRIPDVWNHHFKVACYMIILLVSDYLPDEVLIKKMRDLNLDLKTLIETYKFFESLTEEHLHALVAYGNRFLDKEDFTLTSVINPKNVIDWYGHDNPLGIFKHLLKVEDMPSKPTEWSSGNSVLETKGTGSNGTNSNGTFPSVRRSVMSTGKPSVRRSVSPNVKPNVKPNVMGTKI
jgi:hypothetical protein